MHKHNYFTITGGRTGSSWLASFLSINLKIDEVHEHLGIDDFGEKMPDIRTMRNFNNFGNNEFVQSFWKRKFAKIPNQIYAETNHTLSKCGLVENIILNDRTDNTTIIILKRDLIKQCASYMVRHDFRNVTMLWQWYLHPNYEKKLIDPNPFMQFDNASLPLWYCYEMAARQEYYHQKFSNQIKMIYLNLEDAVTITGAKQFYKTLGYNDNCLLPPPKNENVSKPNNKLIENLKKSVKRIDVNMSQLVADQIKKGFTF